MAILISFYTDIVIIVTVILLLAKLWMTRRHKYWKNKGVQGPEPLFLFGNLKDMLTFKKHIGVVFMDMYNQYKHLPYFGVFMMYRPTIVINDPELIKQILIKDFAYFPDHLFELDPKYEPLSEHLFNVGGERWKAMRTKISPTFTTNKMKYMFETVKASTNDLDQYVEKCLADSDMFDMKQLLSLFGMNVIGSCAFGIDCNAFEEQNSQFMKAGKSLLSAGKPRMFLQLILLFCLPELSRNLKFSLIGKETNDFFYNLIKNTIEYRNENKVKRNDFLQILMHLQEHGHVDETDKTEQSVNEPRLTTMQLAAQSFVFFVAGHETSSTTASFALYELAQNPDVQDTLRENINSVLKKYDGNVTYDNLIEMTYLTQVIEETLRKYPPLTILFRKCVKDYTLPNTNVVVEKGTALMIPLYGIQRDPQYFPDPDKFDPERFSPENKATRNHYIYMPFGEGPRMCIGNRFGLMQTRLGILSIISKFKVSVCEKTKIPIEYNRAPILSSQDGIWLKLTKVNN